MFALRQTLIYFPSCAYTQIIEQIYNAIVYLLNKSTYHLKIMPLSMLLQLFIVVYTCCRYACIWCWHYQFKISDPASCGSPDKQLNTTLEGKNHSVGAQISYACPLGHMLIGDKVRTCHTDAFWSGRAPSCKCEFSI